MLIRRFTASMNTSNSSVHQLIPIKWKKKKKHTKTPDRTPNRLPQRKQQTNSRERLFTPTQRPRVLVPSLCPSLVVRLYLFAPHLLLHSQQDSPTDAPSAATSSHYDQTALSRSIPYSKDGSKTATCTEAQYDAGTLAIDQDATPMTPARPVQRPSSNPKNI
jgi:hypothetical protein